MINNEQIMWPTDCGTDDLVKRSQAYKRLYTMDEAAWYVGLSYWTIRDYVNAGILPTVKLPCSQRRGKNGSVVRRAGDTSARRILIDRADLDRLIEQSKEV